MHRMYSELLTIPIWALWGVYWTAMSPQATRRRFCERRVAKRAPCHFSSSFGSPHRCWPSAQADNGLYQGSLGSSFEKTNSGIRTLQLLQNMSGVRRFPLETQLGKILEHSGPWRDSVAQPSQSRIDQLAKSSLPLLTLLTEADTTAIESSVCTGDNRTSLPAHSI
jgi:hypothetical protein